MFLFWSGSSNMMWTKIEKFSIITHFGFCLSRLTLVQIVHHYNFIISSSKSSKSFFSHYLHLLSETSEQGVFKTVLFFLLLLLGANSLNHFWVILFLRKKLFCVDLFVCQWWGLPPGWSLRENRPPQKGQHRTLARTGEDITDRENRPPCPKTRFQL